MKSIKFGIAPGKFIMPFLSALMLFFFISCSRKTTFMVSTVVPAARGSVKIKKDDNKNYGIKIKISFLTEPERLVPPKKTYVVWVLSNNNNAQNVGQLKSSNKLNASFESVTSSNPFRIYITAEDDATIQYSYEPVVLTTPDF